MRRRWKLLAVVGAVALLAGLPFFLSPGDDNDGFDWIREFGPTNEWTTRRVMPGADVIPDVYAPPLTGPREHMCLSLPAEFLRS